MRKLPPPSSHVIQLTGTIFELNSRIKETNVLSKFRENWAKNVTSTVFTCFHYIHIEKNAPPTGSHVFSPVPTIFKLVRDINKTNVLTNFHDDWAKIVTSRVFTSFLYSQIGLDWSLSARVLLTCSTRADNDQWSPNRENCHYIHIEKNAPLTGGHVFHRSRPISNSKTAPPTGGHVFQRIGTTFELNQDIIKTNILTNFELGRDFIGKKLLTKFHEDGTRNVASRVFTSKCSRTDRRTDIRRTKTGHKSSHEQSAGIQHSEWDTNVLTKFHEDWATELNAS
ncbi:hypothetical protein DPMN_157410 [Dreissena polymorpha]|uniref:Uncharacterized protein n=1 Tax=Dreissena polymorpha TaxID=45954 RepID=A0A9D4EFW6_DREPO|nr:hypothetical protein DPMN_157410 [Dreissena polymorpha]